MRLIEKEDYSQLLPSLLKVGINHLFARTVIEQTMDGDVYVDRLDEPSTCLVKHNYGMSLLWGNPDNDAFNAELKAYVLNKNGKRKGNEWLQVFPDVWNDKLSEMLGPKLVDHSASNSGNVNSPMRGVQKYSRVNFRFHREKYLPFDLRQEHELVLVKAENGLFNQMQGTVVPDKFWRNETEFTGKGAGFCLLKNGEPVSTAFSAFVHEPYLELGIETLAEFQGRGLAGIACSALINFCIEKGLEPVWACRLENVGSFKLAQKLGFEVERIIPYYQLLI